MRRLSIALACLLMAAGVAVAGGQKDSGTTTSPKTGAQAAMKSGGAGMWTTPEAYNKATGKKLPAYTEALALKELVAAGKLPSVDKRLPEEPMVVEAVEQVGDYGGNLVYGANGPGSSLIQRRMGYEPLVRRGIDGLTIVPGLAKGWDVSADARVYNLYLRKGLKWSDGVPFTADDIMFFVECWNMTDLGLAFPGWLKTNGTEGKIEKIDDYTVRFTFADPNGLFLEQLSWKSDIDCGYMPKHYISKFTPPYASIEDLNKMAKEKGFESWTQLWWDRVAITKNIELPVVRGWMLKSVDPSQVILERNPYYYKVDEAGKQLPYIDQRIVVIANKEVINMKAMAGDFDFQTIFLDFANYTLFKENAAKGNYRVLTWLPEGKPPRVPFPELLAYDVDKANRLLDGLGYKWDAAKEKRLGPDGKPIEFIIEAFLESGGSPELYAMVQRYWKAIGITTNIKTLQGELWRNRVWAGETSINPYDMDIYINQNFTDPVLSKVLQQRDFRVALSIALNRDEINEVLYHGVASKEHFYYDNWEIDESEFVPTGKWCYWGPLWGTWLGSQGKEGVEPPQEIKDIYAKYQKVVVTGDLAAKNKLMDEIYDFDMQNLWVIRILNVPKPQIVKNTLRNVKEVGGNESDRTKAPGFLNPEQWYFVKQ